MVLSGYATFLARSGRALLVLLLLSVLLAPALPAQDEASGSEGEISYEFRE